MCIVDRDAFQYLPPSRLSARGPEAQDRLGPGSRGPQKDKRSQGSLRFMRSSAADGVWRLVAALFCSLSVFCPKKEKKMKTYTVKTLQQQDALHTCSENRVTTRRCCFGCGTRAERKEGSWLADVGFGSETAGCRLQFLVLLVSFLCALLCPFVSFLCLFNVGKF